MVGNKGFTLVETLTAMIIFSVIMLFGVTIFAYGNKRMAKSRETGYALQLAKNEMEAVRTMDYNTVAAPTATTVTVTNPQTSVVFSRTRTVTMQGGGLYKKVDVRVAWPDPAATFHVDMSMIIAPSY